jgi:pyrroloquinoline quinone biosynthesis protein B
MKIRILGSAAGGGFPQWNCNCRNCRGARDGSIRTHKRTQSSIAVRGSETAPWILVNASPDILQQLHSMPGLLVGLRDCAIDAIVLTDAQIDHVTGLLMLRESVRPWPLWCTDAVHDELSHELGLLSVLSHYCGVDRRKVDTGRAWFRLDEAGDIEWRAVSLQSKPPPYSVDRNTPRAGSNIALTIRSASSLRSVFYAPGVGEVSADVWEEMCAADLVLVDGTCWTDHELVDLGVSARSARDMGHLPLQGPGGMIEWLERLPHTTRKVLVHINNTNPILDEDSPQRAALAARGIEVAYDGMELEL